MIFLFQLQLFLFAWCLAVKFLRVQTDQQNRSLVTAAYSARLTVIIFISFISHVTSVFDALNVLEAFWRCNISI